MIAELGRKPGGASHLMRPNWSETYCGRVLTGAVEFAQGEPSCKTCRVVYNGEHRGTGGIEIRVPAIRVEDGPRQWPLWTVERPRLGGGVLIDDLKETEEEAAAEVARRGPPWTSVKLWVTLP